VVDLAMKRRGFALGVVLSLIPVLSLMAWTYLEFGTVSRVTALNKEAEIRALHAAEAGIRYYLATGTETRFEMNGCRVQVSLSDTSLVSRAVVERPWAIFEVVLETEKGFVTRRKTNEQN
jgi:hypothetical protein